MTTPNFHEGDLRKFTVGGPCIIRLDGDDPESNGFWFGEIASIDVHVHDDGNTAVVRARFKGGRLNRVGIPFGGPSDGAFPIGAHRVYPFDDPSLELCAELDSLRAAYANETSSLRVALKREKAETRAMEHMFTKTFTELCDLKDRVGDARTVPGIRKSAHLEAHRPRTMPDLPVQRADDTTLRRTGCYSIVNGEVRQEA